MGTTGSLEILECRRRIPAGSEHNATRRMIGRELKHSLRDDRKAWWSQKAQDMENANNSGNLRRLFQLIRSTGPRKLGVSETVCEKNGTLITNRGRRLECWTEHFKDQFSWPSVSAPLEMSSQTDVWTTNLEPPTEEEIVSCINSMKRFKAAGPNEVSPALFKDGLGVLTPELVHLFKVIWEEESVPEAWGDSIIIPVYKKGTRGDCANHRGISLTPVISRLLAALLLRRLTPDREKCIREEQAGFRPGRGCIDHIFTLRQILKQRRVQTTDHRRILGLQGSI
ncbi:uncharacterized protein LOC106467415 [Limulus polyphemus]|uniref:Uncharacterized protein LOC106467415 n=1 Tax=Limulus polyphemus TaxID=6850 RepID=A0ABM1BJG5_LIMPO|nr:uncharacterized protein LOC106467415 [Limulus polyphemus]